MMTARELAKLAQHIIQTYPEYYHIYGEREFTWNKIRQQNRNPLLAMDIGADGMKTGFTKEAGYGLVGSAVQNGMRLIVVVNGLKTAKERADEARKLLEWGFRDFEARAAVRRRPDRRRGQALWRRAGLACRWSAARPIRLHGSARRAAKRSSRASSTAGRCRRR